MGRFVSAAERKALGIEYTGPGPRARKHRRKKAHLVHRTHHEHKVRAKGHLVHKAKVPTLRGNGRLVHFRKRF